MSDVQASASFSETVPTIGNGYPKPLETVIVRASSGQKVGLSLPRDVLWGGDAQIRYALLSKTEAERLLINLHTTVMTLRGQNKPLRWRDRLRKIRQAVRGR